jgi:hypothetical protein
MQVRAGQRVDNNRGQTLDFAVWDTVKPLSRLIYPKPECGAG